MSQAGQMTQTKTEKIERAFTTRPFFDAAADELVIEHQRTYTPGTYRGYSYGARLVVRGPRGAEKYEEGLTLDSCRRMIAALGEVVGQLMAQKAGDDAFDALRNYDHARSMLMAAADDLNGKDVG